MGPSEFEQERPHVPGRIVQNLTAEEIAEIQERDEIAEAHYQAERAAERADNLRATALNAALALSASGRLEPEDIVAAARTFEAYLRGDNAETVQ